MGTEEGPLNALLWRGEEREEGEGKWDGKEPCKGEAENGVRVQVELLSAVYIGHLCEAVLK